MRDCVAIIGGSFRLIDHLNIHSVGSSDKQTIVSIYSKNNTTYVDNSGGSRGTQPRAPPPPIPWEQILSVLHVFTKKCRVGSQRPP